MRCSARRALPGVVVLRKRRRCRHAFVRDDALERREPMAVIGFTGVGVAGRGEDPQWLYTVCFDAQELWGADADPTLKVSIEAFEPYLEHA